MLDYFALFVLLVLCGAIIWVFVVLGRMPGRMARDAGHPQAEAINLLGWIGLLTGGLGWLVALVWSKTVPGGNQGRVDESLVARVEVLEARAETSGGEG